MLTYQIDRKHEVAEAMDVPLQEVDLFYAAWAAIRDAYDRRDLVGCRRLIDTFNKANKCQDH